MSQTYQYLNPEINDAIEKLYLNININSKDQKEKGILELHKCFIEKLSKSLSKGNLLEVSDLILDKSIKISEITENYDWPSAESLKVPNLFRNTNLLYVYVRTRLNLLSGKGKKMIKDGPNKAVDNLVKILTALLEDNISLENNLIYICFEDLLSFYVLSNFNEKSKELIDDLVSFCQEESNINGLSKMENIDKSAEGNFFKGALVTLFQFKLDLITEKKEIDASIVENIFKHENSLRNSCFLLNANFVWVYAGYKFIHENKSEKDLLLCEKLVELFKIGKNYKQFLLPKKSELISIVSKHIEKLRSLIIIYFVNNYIHLSDAIFLELDYKQNEIEELKTTSNYNLSPIIKNIKNNNVEDYNLLKLAQPIIKKLENNSNNEKVSKELKNKFYELIIQKPKKIGEKDIKNNEDYLKMRLTEENNRFKELLKF